MRRTDRFAKLRRVPARLVVDRRGGTAIEYGLILALIVLTMIASFQALASQTVSMWGNVNSKVSTATGN